jgi:NADPH:quinone reductase-like Zn-dependent oxidoreductase
MKAAIRSKYGPPEILVVRDIEMPVPKDNELLVKVFASSVNRTDCAILTGRPVIMRMFTGLLKPRRSITGTDFAGEIVSAGKKVRKFRTGSLVWGFHDMGMNSHAEYIVLTEKQNIVQIPEGCSFEQAAASAEGTHYAYNFINKVVVKTGQKALVNGAAGAIGSSLLQFLKYYNLYVTAVCKSKDTDLVKSLGADKVIQFNMADFTKDDEKYDFVFDSVGKSSFGKCKSLLKPCGVYISSELGSGNENLILALTTSFKKGKRVKFPFPSDIKRSLHFTKNLIEQGIFRPVIDRSYSIEEVSDAFKYVASGEKTGSVILTIGSHAG